ncbi:DMT family transporter [Herbaspirillum chlorophenolicum]|uniref:DMT family transporter n=2 Tax=Herbaspirillum chlorophenolicum TaxID=211589 RepID=UPI000773C38C|nr:DMT family transporter [Herbaspirillum chlorophenolicum]
MKLWKTISAPGVKAALTAALLFGAATPLAKSLLEGNSPWMIAAFLYIGSGVGLFIYRKSVGAKKVSLPRNEIGWLAGAIVFGGVIAPVLLMMGLTAAPASTASLLLNAEGVFTALLAWFAFKENFDRRIALGMVAIVIGAVVLSVPPELDKVQLWPALAILAACFSWGVDNNLTRKVSSTDGSWVASMKGIFAGLTNLTLAVAVGAHLPSPSVLAGTMLLGFLSYGVSLTLFVVALRHLGTARTGAYFSAAPFLGAVLALANGEPLTSQLVIASALMTVGIYLHLTERHVHEHIHEEMEHEHEHTHDDQHHLHGHEEAVAPGVKHTHRHRHSRLTHTHDHFPDTHHRHQH